MSGADRGLAVGAMLSTVDDLPQRDRWARLRFAIIGPLLAAPPVAGELHEALNALAAKAWRHPFTGLEIRFGCSTLERWYYAAKKAGDPVYALHNQVRGDIGRSPTPCLIAKCKRWRERASSVQGKDSNRSCLSLHMKSPT